MQYCDHRGLTYADWQAWWYDANYDPPTIIQACKGRADVRRRAIRSRRGDDRQLHEAIRAGRTTCVAVVQHYIDRARAYNGVCSRPRNRRWSSGTTKLRRGARHGAAALPDRDRQSLDDFPRSRQVQGSAARIRPHGANRVRSFGAAAIRNDRGHSECRAAQCARDPQHQGRAVGDLPRRVRPAPLRGTAAAGRAADLRTFPPIARRSRTRRRARCRLRAQPRSRQDADVRRRLLVQGPVRHEGHAHDRRGRCGLRHRFSGARPCAGRAVAQQGRDHLREGGVHRIQRPRRRSGRPAQARKGVAVGPGLPAQQLGRQPREPIRHDARRLIGVELGLGRLGQRQSGDGEPRRGDPRLDPRARQSQCGRVDPAAQGDAELQWRRDRRRHLLRPHRHPRPHDRRRRQSARRIEGPREGLLRSARPLYDGPALLGPDDPLCEPHQAVGLPPRHAHRDHPRVDAGPPRRQGRRADCDGCGGRDQGDPRREARCDIGRNPPIRYGNATATSSR